MRSRSSPPNCWPPLRSPPWRNPFSKRFHPLQAGLVEPLSERELEVLRLLVGGLSKPEMAARLFLSVNTLRAHTATIYRKLDVHNRFQAAVRAKELGLLTG